MGRHAAKYSDEQRDAIVAAVLDQGLSAREATVAAAGGDLDPAPFEMPVSTAQALVTDAKNRGRAVDNTDRLHQLVHAILDIAQAGITKLEQKANRGTLTAQDATFGRRLTQLAGQAAQLNNALAADPPPVPPPSSNAARDLRERMEQDLAAMNGSDGTSNSASAPEAAASPSPRDELLKELQEVANRAGA